MSKASENDKRKEGLAEELLRAVSADTDAGAGFDASQARPGFRETSYNRIQGRLSREGEPGHRDTKREGRRGLVPAHRARLAILIPAATLALMMLFTTGAFAFSLDAAPDSSLYGTKLFFESTRLSLTGSGEAKVDYEMELVDKRLDELESMVGRGARRGGPHWEEAYRNNVDRLYREIMNLPEERQAEVLEYAATVLEEQAEAMVSLGMEATQDLAPSIEGARECGMGAMQGMRGQCRKQDGDYPGNGNGSVKGNGNY